MIQVVDTSAGRFAEPSRSSALHGANLVKGCLRQYRKGMLTVTVVLGLNRTLASDYQDKEPLVIGTLSGAFMFMAGVPFPTLQVAGLVAGVAVGD